MVIVLQLLILMVALFWRGRGLFGRHLRRLKGDPGRLQYLKHGKTQIVTRHEGIERSGGVSFIVRRERWYHRYFKKLGLATEISMPNAAFDRVFFVTTDFPHHLEKLMHDTVLQERLYELMGMDVAALYVMPHKMWCVMEGRVVTNDDSSFQKQFAKMREIDAAAKMPETGPVMARGRLKITWALLFLAAHAAVLSCGILGAMPLWFDSIDTIDNRLLAGYGVLVGVVALIVWGGLILALFKGTSWFGWVMADFWLWGMLGFVLCGLLVLRDVNVTAPQPPAVVYQQPVTAKLCMLKCGASCRGCKREYHDYRDQNCEPIMRQQIEAVHKARSATCERQTAYRYSVLAASWRPEDEGNGYRVILKQPVFDALQIGSMLSIPVNRGAVGMEWGGYGCCTALRADPRRRL